MHDKVDPYVCGTYHILSRLVLNFNILTLEIFCNHHHITNMINIYI